MIQRDIEHLVSKSIQLKEITILVGARQVGKPTLLKHIAAKLHKNQQQTLFLNFDIEKDAAYLESQEKLIKKASLEFGDKRGYLFIDEIQRKQNAGLFLKGIYDSGFPHKLIVTGSGSLELKEKISESLMGRKDLITMRSVSFRELVNYQTNYKYTDKLEYYFESEEGSTYNKLLEYLTYGGYPRLVTEKTSESKSRIIREIFNTYVTRDITQLLNLRSPEKFVRFIRLLATRIGEISNYSNLASEINISTDTLKQYLYYAEQTFTIDTVKPFYTNPSKELVKSPVFYFTDLGLLNFALNRFGQFYKEQSGFLFQNLIYLMLKDKYYNELDNIRYWRTKEKAEVDFVVKDKNGVIPFEVKFSSLKKDSFSRSFRSFIDKYQPKEAYIVNIDRNSTALLNQTTIHFIPFWKLLFL